MQENRRIKIEKTPNGNLRAITEKTPDNEMEPQVKITKPRPKVTIIETGKDKIVARNLETKPRVRIIEETPQEHKVIKVRWQTMIEPQQLAGLEKEVMFTRQNNFYDCGPCAILNTLQLLDINTDLQNVRDVRNFNNKLRTDAQQEILADDEWFFVKDVEKILRQQKLSLKQIYTIAGEQAFKEVETFIQTIKNRPQDFVVYTATGRHFSLVYYLNSDHIYRIDSLSPQIERINAQELGNFIAEAKKRIDNVIGVATKSMVKIK